MSKVFRNIVSKSNSARANYYFKRSERGLLLLAFLMVFLLLSGVSAYSQEPPKDPDESVESVFSGKNTRTPRQLGKKISLVSKGLSKYLRWAVHDGNLVTGAVINSGLLSYHYVSGSPRISWPKGANVVSYLHSGVFWVAAEVIDARGDTIHIVSDNYRRSNAETAPDYSHMYATMPLPKYFNLDQPEATQTPEIGGISEDVGVDGNPRTNDFGEGDGILQPQEDFNQNGKLDLHMKNTVGWFAISHRKETWPEYWPAGSYPGDDREAGEERPGVRAGRWNGEYGAYIRADQESYYLMTDRENDEFEYYPVGDTRPWPDGRRGLGLITSVRNYQWNARLAEDILISIYDITDVGKDLTKCIVGSYIDPDMGGAYSGDDAAFDRVQDITYAWNKNFRSIEGKPMGYFGFAFLESPGLIDGIDNDEDGMVDESQNDGIDNDGDWESWTDENGNGVWDNEDSNHNGLLDPGEDVNGNGILDIEPLNDDLGSDGLGPEYDGYPGPDPDGTEGNGKPDEGEPDFDFTDNDESDQVGLTSFYLRDVDNTVANDEKYWITEIQPGTFKVRAGYQRDICWSYGSGFIQFSGQEKTHRYAIALIFGNDKPDIVRNKRTMQVIYDADYNFTKPPRQPLLTATAGNKKVYLNWDAGAERSRDPIYGHDFEAYYIYKSTEPSFGDIKTITDGFGNPLLFKPIAIFDKKDGLKGIHPVRIGSELGPDSDLGISYNMGTDSGVRHSYVDTTVTNGRTYYYAVVSVDRGYDPSFYPDISEREGLQPISPTECSANIQTDPLGRPISMDQDVAVVTPVERPAGWVTPGLADDGITHTLGLGTGSIDVRIVNPLKIKPGQRYRVEFGDDGSFEALDSLYTGLTNRMTMYSDTDNDGIALISMQNPETNELADEFVFDGVQVLLHNDTTDVDTTFWAKGNSVLTIKNMTQELRGTAIPRDYEFRIKEFGADTSINGNRVTNFQVWDVTDRKNSFKLAYRFTDSKTSPDSLKGFLKAGVRVILVNNPVSKKQMWKFDFIYPPDSDSTRQTLPENGDVLAVITKKNFDRNDVFEFAMQGNDIERTKANNDLSNIYTVPDPYVAVSTVERKVINLDEGRGDRRIDFVNLPNECTIKIFTASGKFVRKLDHYSDQNFSREPWDLRTKDGLEITHGIYFYVVEAPGIGKKAGKFAVIK